MSPENILWLYSKFIPAHKLKDSSKNKISKLWIVFFQKILVNLMSLFQLICTYKKQKIFEEIQSKLITSNSWILLISCLYLSERLQNVLVNLLQIYFYILQAKDFSTNYSKSLNSYSELYYELSVFIKNNSGRSGWHKKLLSGIILTNVELQYTIPRLSCYISKLTHLSVLGLPEIADHKFILQS